ncbi:MAG: NigD-like protein [Tannerellaceae bacterium]|nr:NigD-like protein [Tannerellaceae bacterium]
MNIKINDILIFCMKRLVCYFKTFVLTLLIIGLNSCLSNNDGYSLDEYRMSYATARPINDNSFFFSLDNGATLWPASPLYLPFQPQRPQRVQINYTLLGRRVQGYDYAVKVNRVDTILTKTLSADMQEKNDSIYGKDPLKLEDLWIGDGFLNIIFEIEYSGRFKHSVNLLCDTTDGYKLDVRYNAFEDKSDLLRYGIVAFDLSSIDTRGKDVELIIKVNTFEGVKEYKSRYNSLAQTKATDIQPELKLELQPELKLDKNSLE